MAHLPADAFDQYAAMGPARTYQGLARRLGVSKRTVTRKAVAQDWQARLIEAEAHARVKSDEKLAESMEAINTRHLKTLRLVQSRALQALAKIPMVTGSQALNALVAAIKAERAIVAPEGDHRGATLEEMVGAAGRSVEARRAELRDRIQINVITGVSRPDDADARPARVLPAEAESRWVPEPPNGST